MKNLKAIVVFLNVLRSLYPMIQEWVEAIDSPGHGEEKKKEIMEAVKATIEAIEQLSGVDLPWESIIEPLASTLVEMAVRALKRKQEAEGTISTSDLSNWTA